MGKESVNCLAPAGAIVDNPITSDNPIASEIPIISLNFVVNCSDWPLGASMNDIFRLLLASRKIRLGPLEERLLSAMWQQPEGVTIRELRDRADIGRAYITIVTTLNRLRKKGLVDRIAVDGSKVVTFRYVPRFTMAEVESDVASHAIREVLGLDLAGPLLLSRMVEEISQHDAELLEELGRLVDEKRRNGQK
jgi:predicted transcriptional regulator